MKTNAPCLGTPAADPAEWLLDPRVVFLNHGAFGACPRAVLAHQQALRERMERQPLQFLARDLEPLLDAARGTLAEFVGADPADLVFVPNATAGVNSVLRGLELGSDAEILVTNQEYNACRNAAQYAAARQGARVVVAAIPFPLVHEDEIVQSILAAVTPRTRLAMLDHVVSQTGLILPIARLARELAARGVDLLVDGAHAPGMVPLDLTSLGAAYYTGNLHKWVCAPKGAAFLHVRRDRQAQIRPLVISHGANSARTDRSRFLIEFAWPGTWDPSACLSVPVALDFLATRLPGGWPAVMARNHALALAARAVLCTALGIAEPCPPANVGSTAAVPLPDAPPDGAPTPPVFEYPLQTHLRESAGIEVPLMPWPAPPRRLLRVSAQLYNSLPQYEFLATQLCRALGEGR